MNLPRKRRIALVAIATAAIGTPIANGLGDATWAGSPPQLSRGQRWHRDAETAGFFLILGAIAAATLEAVWKMVRGR